MKRSFLTLMILPLFMVFNSVFFGAPNKKEYKDIKASFVNNKLAENDCKECHSDIYNKKFMHAPASESCENCHISNRESHPSDAGNDFSLAEKGSELCLMCHDVNSKKNIHYPITEENCNICHSPHSSDYSKLLIKYPTSGLCYTCHDAEETENKVVHYPYSEGDCSSCHDAHQSDYPSFMKERTNKLCIDCHSDVGEEMKKEFVHYPADDNCLTCHKPHVSKEKDLLDEKEADVCYTCHEALNTKKHVHEPVKEGECKLCHTPHGSNYEKFLIAKQEDLCIQCHQKTIWKEFKNKEQVEKNLNIHGAIEMGGCYACHKAHSTDINSLLTAKYPSGLYAPAIKENFAMCFECHDGDLITNSTNNKHVTGFRNGNQNLHFLHINGEKGRNCNNCHDTHSSINDHLILKNVMFGNWEMPLKYKSTENGGSCTPGCHGETIYVR